MTIVWVQRYPSDTARAISFKNDDEAQVYFQQKQEDYRYTTGQVWVERAAASRELEGTP